VDPDSGLHRHLMLLLRLTIVVVAQLPSRPGCTRLSATLQWTLDAYALTLASLLLTSGALADVRTQAAVRIGLTIFTLGSLLCGLGGGPAMLILSRCGRASGGAVVFATSLALLGHSFRGKDRGTASASGAAVTGVATAATGARRPDHHGTGLARDLPRQQSRSAIFAVAVTIRRGRGIPRTPAHQARLDRVRPAHGRAGRLHLRTYPGQRRPHGLHRGPHLRRGWHRAARRVSCGPRPGSPTPMFDMRLLRVPTFAGGSSPRSR